MLAPSLLDYLQPHFLQSMVAQSMQLQSELQALYPIPLDPSYCQEKLQV